jgi:hypothetical protein
MARTPTLIDLLDRLEPEVRRAFERAVQIIAGDVRVGALEAAIRAGDIAAAMSAVELDPSYFRPLEEALRAAHLSAGDQTFDGARKLARRRGAVLTGRFDSRNLRAESVLRHWSSTKIVEITTSTAEAVRETLTELMTRGTSPRSAARQIVGSVGPGGRRTGGIIGLDSNRASWVRNMGEELRTSSSNYFTRKLRDRRFDSVVRRAIRTGKPLTEAEITKITARYSGRLLKMRGEAIARTELLGSLHAAQAEGLQQMVDSGQVRSENIQIEWDASNDRFTRRTHREADGQRRRQGEDFTIGGYPMAHPGDGSRAPAGEVINCRCVLRPDIDFVAGLRGRLTPAELALTRSLM